jgi:D-lactate dehydrogenase (cytochrome)
MSACPISRLAECVLETRADVQRQACSRRSSATPATATSISSPDDPDDPAELQKAKEINARLVARALAMAHLQRRARRRGRQDGVPRAEHGASLEVMKAIKRALDSGEQVSGKMTTSKRPMTNLRFRILMVIDPSIVIRRSSS